MQTTTSPATMQIELRNVQIFDCMSEETMCFHASLYINNKKVGFAKNDGQGGMTSVQADSADDVNIINEAEEYCKTLPPQKHYYNGEKWETPMTLEDFVDNIAYEVAGRLQKLVIHI